MGGGKVLQYIGAKEEANAASKAAAAQYAEAGRAKVENLREARRGEKLASSVQELNALDSSLKYAQKQAETDQRLIDSIDPALMEASSQVLKLLRGEQSSVGGALENQRTMQRQKLVNSLREQLGPGAETSTAGIQALTRFDSETGQLSVGAQQQGLGTLMNTINSGRFDNRGITSLLNVGTGFGNRSGRQMQGASGVLNAMMGGNAGIMQMTGHEFLKDQMMGRNKQQLGKEWSQDSAQFMGIMGGAFTGGAGGGSKPGQAIPMDQSQYDKERISDPN